MSENERNQLREMLEDFKSTMLEDFKGLQDRMLTDLRELFGRTNRADTSIALLSQIQQTQQKSIDNIKANLTPIRDRFVQLEHKADAHAHWCQETHKRWDDAVAQRKSRWWDIEKAVLAAVLISIVLGLINFGWNATNRQLTESVARQVQRVLDTERQNGGAPQAATREDRH